MDQEQPAARCPSRRVLSEGSSSRSVPTLPFPWGGLVDRRGPTPREFDITASGFPVGRGGRCAPSRSESARPWLATGSGSESFQERAEREATSGVPALQRELSPGPGSLHTLPFPPLGSTGRVPCALHSVENLQGCSMDCAVRLEGTRFESFVRGAVHGDAKLGRLRMSSLVGGCQCRHGDVPASGPRVAPRIGKPPGIRFPKSAGPAKNPIATGFLPLDTWSIACRFSLMGIELPDIGKCGSSVAIRGQV